MRFSILVIILMVLAFTVSAQAVNKIIVKVNGQVITSRDLDEYCKVLILRIFDPNDEIRSNDKEFKAKALTRLIEDTLILDKAKRDGVEVDPGRIENKVNQLISSHASREEFEESLIEKGLTITLLRQKIKEQYMLRDTIDRYIKSQISVLPKEISDYYTEHRQEFYASPGYVFYIAKLADRNALVTISELINSQGILAAKAQYGNILFRIESNQEELRLEIAEFLENLGVGEHKIKKINELFYLIYLEQTITARALPLDEVKEAIYAYLKDIKFREKFTQWVNELRADALIKNYYE